MWPFDDEDETTTAAAPAAPAKEQAGPPVTAAPDPVVRDYIMKKYNLAADDSGVRDAEKSQRNMTALSSILGGIGQIASAGSVSRGGPGVDSRNFKVMTDVAGQEVDSARRARADKMQAFDAEQKIGADVTAQGRAGDEFANKKAGWAREAAERRALEDPNSPETRQRRELAAKFTGKTPEDFNHVNGAQLDKNLPMMEHLYKIEQQRQARLDALNAQAGQRADAKAERELRREEIKKDKQDAKDAAVRVPDLEVMSGYAPAAKDTADVRKAKEYYDNLTQNLARLDASHKRSGTNLTGDDAAEQAAIVTDIQMNLKELQNLGVLTGPDLALLQKQVPDPTAFAENVKDMVGEGRYDTVSKTFRTTLDTRYDNALRSRGYQRAAKNEAGVVGNSPAAGAVRDFLSGGGGVANPILAAAEQKPVAAAPDKAPPPASAAPIGEERTTPDGVRWRKVKTGWQRVK